jgi:putative PIN family toxin of toxin-antitoxin system
VSLRLILDTNTLVSALVFADGRLGWLRHAWQSGRLVPLICRETADELLRVLAYPKFKLDRDEVEALLADFLPYAETVAAPVSSAPTPRCRDPKDQVFVDLLVAACADGLITGDKDLLVLATEPGLPIQTPAALREQLGSGG